MKKIFVVMILFIFYSCGGDVSQNEYDNIVAKNKLLNKRIEQLKSEMSDDLFGDNDNTDDFKEVDKTKEKEKFVEDIAAKSFIGMGSWQIDRYVDEFGDYTNEYHIRNKKFIEGKFSNSATDGSKLTIVLLITDKKSCAVKLWEYGNNPVKREFAENSKYNNYTVSIKGKNFLLNKKNPDKICTSTGFNIVAKTLQKWMLMLL